MRRSTAEVIREAGPFSGGAQVGGVTYDGHNVWVALGAGYDVDSNGDFGVIWSSTDLVHWRRGLRH